jgi:signal transduction histidine kinase
MTTLGTTLSSRTQGAGGVRTVITALLILTVGVNALYLVGLVASGGENNPFVGVGLGLATQWVPATIFWLVAAHTRFTRLPVVLAAAGVTVSALGDTYYSLAMDADGYLPSPSLADPAYLLFYPLLVAALITLVRGQLRGAGRLVLLETAVATVGASAVLAVVLDPVIRSSIDGGDALAGAVAISYPLFDLLLLAVIAGVAVAPTIRLGRRWWALIAGLLVTAIGDVAYALLGSVGTYLAGTPLDATWAIGLGLMAWWVAGMAEPDTDPVVSPRRIAAPVPSVAVLAGLAVLVVATQLPVSILAVVLAALTVGLGAVPTVFRQWALGRMLADQEEAVRRLTALDRAKTDVMVTMNHEFRTPLTSIAGHVELLIDGGAGELPAAALPMLESIERNTGRLQSLIDETLTAERLEDGPDLTLARVDVADLTRRALRRVEALAVQKTIEIALEGEESGLVVEADDARLEHALVHLLGNAVKFSAPGGRVTVTTERGGRDTVVIRVRDEGIGIPAADLASIPSRFFRASNVQNAAIPGVGLGLSIAQQVVRAHGGSLEVASTLGEGTTVSVQLPMR